MGTPGLLTASQLFILMLLSSAHSGHSDSSTELAWICPQSHASPSLPSSVHSLRPADVSALSVLGLSTAHRSAEVKIVSRLSEILSGFNPKMTTLIPEQRSLIEEAEDVVQSLDSNQWKLLLVFVSVNEICICSDQAASSTVESVVHKVEEVLNKLHEKLDHALVHVAVWGGRDGGRICDCEEDISADTQTWRELERATMMTNIQDSLGALLQRHQQWSEEENFTVVLQSSPTYFDWSDDLVNGNLKTLMQLWSKLLQPMTSKEEEEGRGMAVSCPSHEKPYLYTQRNSVIQPERKSHSAELRINPMATSFPCTVTSPSCSVPTSVHFLRPADVKVVAALGDSLTAGNGVGQNGVLGVLTEYRGLSWSIGGNGDLSSVTTLPNILRKFNPSLTGFSTGTGKASTAQAFLNQAVAGAESKDLPSQARALITRMKSDSRIDFQKDWKVITLLIGGNDLCEQCTDPDFYSAENFAKNIGVALDILQEEVPRVLVNLVELFDIVSLRQLHQDSKLGCPTWLVRSICPCVVNPAEGSSELQALIEMNKAYQIATRNLVDSGGYNTHTDFTVVLQPFFRNTTFPVLLNGTPDRSFFAGDCFHLSQKSHTLMARALWNNMLEPEHSKTTSVDFNEDVAMKCPSETAPYFSTNGNSVLKYVATPISENWGSDFSCTHTAPSDTVPSSVHRLRPGDINIIAALGDSITAGFRAKSTDILQQLLNEDRGVSWSIGGDESLETVTTLANILKKFNPHVFGFSQGRSTRPNGFNMAVRGAKAMDIPGQVRDLVEALKSSTSVDLDQDWKLVTLFIGVNDLCEYCENPTSLSPKKYVGHIRDALDILYNEVPRVLVNVVEVPQIEEMRKIKSDSTGCTVLQPTLCPCFLYPEENTVEMMEMKINQQIQMETEKLVSGGQYKSRKDFAVVLQPFFQRTVIPVGADQKPDLSFFSFDCFHFTERGHAEMAIALWNNMLEPVGSKQTYNNFTHDRSKIRCPSEENPYIFTQVNSFNPEPVDPTLPLPSPIQQNSSLKVWIFLLSGLLGGLVGGVIACLGVSCTNLCKRDYRDKVRAVKISFTGYKNDV